MKAVRLTRGAALALTLAPSSAWACGAGPGLIGLAQNVMLASAVTLVAMTVVVLRLGRATPPPPAASGGGRHLDPGG